MDLLIGGDPEFFVSRNKKGKERIISGHRFKCGTKEEPLETPHGSVQVDGIALEANIRPSKNMKEFMVNTYGVLSDLEDIIRRKHNTFRLLIEPTAHLPERFFRSLPPEVRTLGCNPDYNAYTEKINLRPQGNVPFRTAAGHVHIGWTEGQAPDNKDHFNLCCQLAKQLDYYLGLPSILWDSDQTRRGLYGQAGAFRPKRYGMEYRVLSNRWLANKKWAAYVYRNTRRGILRFFDGHVIDEEHKGFAKDWINRSGRHWVNYVPSLAREIGIPPEVDTNGLHVHAT